MTTIKSLYIPHVEKQFNAEFIADLFSKNGLARVSKVYLKPNYRHNRAYIEIESWKETEVAYSFIKRLRNPSAEARLVYSDDNWWVTEINRYPTVFASNNRVLTVFPKQIVADEVNDERSTAALADEENLTAVSVTDDYDVDEYLREIDAEREEWYQDKFIMVDAAKTQQLRDIISNFKEKNEMKLMEQEEADAAEYEAYLREMDWVRNVFRREVTSDLWDETFWY
jgi:hypothetical protein